MNPQNGIMEKKIISSLHKNFDDLIISKIVDNYIYPKFFLVWIRGIEPLFNLLLLYDFNAVNYLFFSRKQNNIKTYLIRESNFHLFKILFSFNSPFPQLRNKRK